MTFSKTLLFGFVLISVLVQIESRVCHYIRYPYLNCEHHCCGEGPIYQCKEDCNGISCDSDDDCGDGCCRDDKCDDCPLSKTIIIVIAVAAVVFLIIVVVVCVCCGFCCCRRSQPTQAVVGQWTHLHNANNMAVATPSVNIVNSTTNSYIRN